MKQRDFFFILVILVFSSTLATQSELSNLFGVATYTYHRDSSAVEASLTELRENKPQQYAIIADNFRRDNQITNQFTFELYFDNSSSISRLIPEANTDIAAYTSAKMLVNGDFRYYLNRAESKRMYEMSPDHGASFLHITEDFNKFSWKITNEVRMIGDYKCRKAIGSMVRKTVCCGDVTDIVEAWFAPSLPYPFGPMGYDGLPGLILEVSTGGKIPGIFRIKRINLDKSTNKSLPELHSPVGIMSAEQLNELYAKRIKRIKGKN